MSGHDNPAYSPDEEGGIQLRSIQRVGSGNVDPQDLLRVRSGVTHGREPGHTPGYPGYAAGSTPELTPGYIPAPDPAREPTQGAVPETTPRGSQETRFGAANGVSEARRKPTWSLPDLDLGFGKVKDKAIGFVRQGSSRVSALGKLERVSGIISAGCGKVTSVELCNMLP